MSAVGLLILQVVVLRTASAQFGGGGGGGPSTFGYDASSACSKPYSRYGRARFEKLPCDFRRQNWCTVAGNTYPWHAVRRFVQENHGLMRRMYGDERHINILKAELEKNDIELEYEDSYQRYPDDARRFQYDDEYEFVDPDQQQHENRQRSKSRDDESYQGRSFTGGSIEEPTTERTRKYTKSTEEYTRPRNRPTESSTAPTSTSSTTTTTTTSSTTSRATPGSTMSGTESSKSAEFSTTSEKTTTPKESFVRSSSTTSSSTSSSSSPAIVTEAPDENIATSSGTVESVVIRNSPTPGKVASTAAAVTLADIARIKNSSINEIPGQSERVKDHSTDPSQVPIVPESVIEDTTLEPEGTSGSATLSTIDRIGEADPADNFEDSGDAAFAASEQMHVQQEFRPRPEFKPADARPEGSGHESQLFQDVAAKDKQDQPVLKLRGVNACPVKEEVVAPFWANNTRGEVLALLNLYPFEQYVHWEKCTHENKQMYCRDGCRCEQQYRLHRLLAYDPNNECRGIFSDWFKFPSCCVCRCYDLPVEFRVTSRSPRIQKQKLKLRTPGHRRG